MNTYPTSHTELPPALALAARIDAIMGGFCLLIAARFRILGALTIPVWTRFSRARRRLAMIFASLAAGRLPRARAPEARFLHPRPLRVVDPMGLPAHRISRRPTWLIAVVGYEMAGYASQLQHLLDDPTTHAQLAATPGIARALRPLCRILGVTLPLCLASPDPPPRPAPAQPRPRRAYTPRPPKPATPAPDPSPPGPNFFLSHVFR